MKKGIVLVILLAGLLSGCVATTERLETRPVRAQKLMDG